MYLIDHIYEVVPANATPLQKEDPYTVMAYDLFTKLWNAVLAKRGNNIRLAIAFANCFGGWTFCEPQVLIPGCMLRD